MALLHGRVAADFSKEKVLCLVRYRVKTVCDPFLSRSLSYSINNDALQLEPFYVSFPPLVFASCFAVVSQNSKLSH